jgi:hypothetical protein
MEEALKNLRTNNFDAKFAENIDAVNKIVLRMATFSSFSMLT